MFNKPSWNNKRGGYLKPPDQSQEEKRTSLLDKMKTTVSQKQKEAQQIVEKIPLSKIAQQKHYDLDKSIEAEVQKTTKVQQTKTVPKIPRTPFNPVVIPSLDNNTETKTNSEQISIPDESDPGIDEFLESFRIVLKNMDKAQTEVDFLNNAITQTDLEITDLLHSVELTPCNEKEKIDLFDKIKEVRLRRRKYKKRLDYFREILDYVTEHKKAFDAATQLNGKLNRIKEKQSNAVYYIRVRKDIKIDENIRAHGPFNQRGDVT
jgi:hypothetical protein